MFIRLKTDHITDFNVNANHVVRFLPNGTGSTIVFANGEQSDVLESPRSIRHAIKKASAPADDAAG